MTTPLIRAAQAVAAYTEQRMPPRGDIVTCEGIARAVLRAVREPSPEMLDAAAEVPPGDVVGSYAPDGDYEYRSDESPALIWTAMIDAALSECEDQDDD